MPVAILVVDADPFIRTLCADTLSPAGFEVRVEADIALALAAIERMPFDLVLASVGLAQPYAQALLSQARRLSPYAELIGLIDRDVAEAGIRALRDGAFDCLLKPITAQALLLTVERCHARQTLVQSRPGLGQEMTLLRRWSELARAPTQAAVTEALVRVLAEQAGAKQAVLLRQGEHGEMELVARDGMTSALASQIAASWRDRERGGRTPPWRDLSQPLVLDIAGRFTAALFDASRQIGTLGAELAPLVSGALSAMDLVARYGEAAAEQEAIDPLTGVYVRGYLARVLEEEVVRARAGASTVALLALDLDGFRALNEAQGHLIGGCALIEAARLLERCVRHIDVVARTGGDEYAAVLHQTNGSGARGAAERIRRAFESHLFLVRERLEVKLTVSIGVAASPEHGGSAEAVLHAAEGAMNQAKEQGRNRVVVSGEAPV